MKRKIGIPLIVAFFAFGLAACGNTEASSANNDVTTEQTQKTDTNEPADTTTQADNNEQSTTPVTELPGLNVAVINEKMTNITIYANGGEYYGYKLDEAHMNLENDGCVTIECKGRQGASLEGVTVDFVFDNGTISVTRGGATETWGEDSKQ